MGGVELLLLDESAIPRKPEITELHKLYEDTNLLELGEASGRRGGRALWARAIYFSAGANRAGNDEEDMGLELGEQVGDDIGRRGGGQVTMSLRNSCNGQNEYSTYQCALCELF